MIICSNNDNSDNYFKNVKSDENEIKHYIIESELTDFSFFLQMVANLFNRSGI